jgi:hypothetical protein
MKHYALVLTAFIALAGAVPAAAQAPAPSAHPTGAVGVRKVPVTNLQNPANRKTNGRTMSGQGCISGPTSVRAQNTINPVTGQPQAATIVSVPLGRGGGSVASATTRAQQTQACAHGH